MIDDRLILLVDPVHGHRPTGDLLRAAVAGGVTCVQVRAPAASARALHAATVAVRDLLAGTGVAVTVDDRLDVALAAGVDGVHLGQGDLPPGPARLLVGDAFDIGWTVTLPEHVEAARALPVGTVDRLGAGPVFTSTTTPDAGEGIGLDALADLAARSPVRVVAVGGITPGWAPEVMTTGVHGLAVASAIGDAADPEAATRALRRAVDGCRARSSDAGG